MLALRRIRLALAVAAATVTTAVSACGGDEQPAADAKVKVVAALAPIAEAAQAVGGAQVTVENLTPVGGQPHGLEPSPGALAALKAAKVVLSVGPEFQPAVTDAIATLPGTTVRADLLGSEDLLPPPKAIPGTRGLVDGATDASSDPHVWVSPKRFISIVEQIREALIKASPESRAVFTSQAERYLVPLRQLDADFKAALADCASTTLLTTHPAFTYLARDYGLTQAVTTGISVSAKPDPVSLAATARYVRAQKVGTVFFAAPVPGRLARSIQSSTGAKVGVLNPVEGLTQDQLDQREGYLTLMRANLTQLQQGLDCEAPGT